MLTRKTILAILLLAAASFRLSAQSGPGGYQYADRTSDIRARASIAFDAKLMRGMHLTIEEQGRFKDGMSSFDRIDSDVAVSFKVLPFLKAETGYTFIWEPLDIRHRTYASLTGHFKTGQWNFSLKEKVQCTHLTKEFNEYQQPRNGLCLKSRVKVSYKCFAKPFEPYAFCELRTRLNGAQYTDYLDPSTMSYSDTFNDRLRFGLGSEWRLDRNNFLEFYVLTDKIDSKKVDAKKNGELKTITFMPAVNLTLGAAWRFKL